MRLTLLCQAATMSTRDGGFPAAADPVDPREHRRIAAVRDLSGTAHVGSGGAAAETATLLGLQVSEDAALRDVDHGTWAGRSFEDVATADADRFTAWLAAPWSATPGGEAFADVVTRVGGWLDALGDEAALAIASPTVIRAALCHAIAMPPPVAMRVDIAPLGRAVLSHHRGWRLQALSA